MLAIMGAVTGGITTLFVSATRAEIDMNMRFQAQQHARVALARVRRETHCATAITPSGASSSVTLDLPIQCKIASGLITWCAVAVPGTTDRYRLHRSLVDPCGDADDRIYADYLTSATLFDHTVQSTAGLGKLRVTLPVDVDPAKPGQYTLVDTIYMRNTTRTCIATSPSPPC